MELTDEGAKGSGRVGGFTVRRIGVKELTDDETFVVGLTEDDEGAGRALVFMVSLAFDEQDRALGMDTYCVSNEVGATVYGGVASCVLELTFEPSAAETLVVHEECRFPLQLDEQSIAHLRRGLRRVLASGQSPPDPLVL